MSDRLLDARHLLCPMPVIKIQQAIQDLSPGQVLRVLCTDPGVRFDVPAWVEMHGHRILKSNCEHCDGDADIYFEIQVIAA